MLMLTRLNALSFAQILLVSHSSRVTVMASAAVDNGAVAADVDIADPAASAATSAGSSAKSSKNARKKANKKAKSRLANATISACLEQCRSLRHEDVLGAEHGWFRAFASYKQRYCVSYVAAEELTDPALEWIFRLTRHNMKTLYQKTPGWGWNDKDKLAEARHADARYFIVTQVDSDAASAAASASSASSAAAGDSASATATPASAASASSDASVEEQFQGTPVAFCQVRFTTGDDDGAPIAYVYELQLESSVQRQGLGRYLMSLVELFAWRCQLLRVVLTVFDANAGAVRLYRSTLRYELDETDPSLHGLRERYSILAKKSPKVHSVADIVLPLIAASPASTDVAAASAAAASTGAVAK